MILYQGGGALLWHKLIEEWHLKNEFPKFDLLISFAETKKIHERKSMKRIFFDSGAYSAWSKGKIIDIKEYITFLHANKNKIEVYANLDVIGNARESYINYKTMKDEGLNPLPVFHNGVAMKYLDMYLKHTNYIGLGGVAKANRKTRVAFFHKVFSQFSDRNKCKFHGFGITAKELLTLYPWYSVDSTAAAMCAINGAIMTKWGSMIVSNRVKNKKIFNEKQMQGIMEYLKSKNYSLDDLNTGDMPGTIERLRFNFEFMEDFIKENSTDHYTSRVNFLF